MLRTILFAIILIIDTIIFASLVVLSSIFNRYSSFIYRTIMRGWSKIILLAANIKVEVAGKENVKSETPYMVISNHQSHMDIPALVCNLPLRLTFLAKKELFKIPFFGWGMQAAGVLKIDRSDRQKAIQTLKKAEKIIIEKHLSVLAFPEGTRSNDGEIHSFKKGSFVMAINTGLPILPVTIRGTYDILPKKKLIIKPGKVQIKIHPAMETKSYNFDTRNELVEKVHEKIVKDFYEN